MVWHVDMLPDFPHHRALGSSRLVKGQKYKKMFGEALTSWSLQHCLEISPRKCHGHAHTFFNTFFRPTTSQPPCLGPGAFVSLKSNRRVMTQTTCQLLTKKWIFGWRSQFIGGDKRRQKKSLTLLPRNDIGRFLGIKYTNKSLSNIGSGEDSLPFQLQFHSAMCRAIVYYDTLYPSIWCQWGLNEQMNFFAFSSVPFLGTINTAPSSSPHLLVVSIIVVGLRIIWDYQDIHMNHT